MNTPVIETLNNRVTIRTYQDKPVSNDMVRAILSAARRSPTSSNMQTYSIVVVRDPETKKQLAVLAGNQRHVEECPVFFAFCADLHRLEQACALHGETLVKSLETTLVATVDAALVGMSAQTAVESLGLGAVMIGGMRNHPAEVAELLGLPSGVYVVFGMCVGWPDPASLPAQKPRLPEELVIHHERYDDRDPTPLVQQYDAALAAHYNAQGNNQHTAAWSGPIAQRLNGKIRPFLRPTLEKLGFAFD